MSNRRREFVQRRKEEMPEYSKQELEKFGEFLEGFKEEKEVTVRIPKKGIVNEMLAALAEEFSLAKKEKIHPINMQEAMVAFGAMVKRGGTYAVLVSDARPTKYELFWDKYEAWEKSRARKAFAQERELDELDAMKKEALEHARAPEPVEPVEF